MEYTYFFHLTSPFSNFHPAKFEYKGLTFISNEQFMMYSKAKNFNDDASAEKILELNQDPLAKKFLNGELSREYIIKDKSLSDQWNKLMMKVKKLGRGVQNYDEVYWESRRYKIVLFGVRLKFTQNPDLKDILIATGDSKMIESSPYDKLSTMEPILQKLKEEFLGKILDELKLEFKNEISNTINIKVANIYHLNKTIPSNGIYIGRFNKGLNLEQSKFANPFPMKDNSEEERNRVVSEYKEWLWKEIANNNINKNDLLLLNNKVLVCFCHPKKCHGDILKETVELLINNENEFDNKIKEYSNKKMKL